jgi:uncharacterized protein YcnI
MKYVVLSGLLAVFAVIALPAAAFAHVVVTPKQADTAQRLVFTVSVPNEKSVAVTHLKLTIPKGVADVLPTSKGGWDITTAKNSDGEVAAIEWAGTIPAGERQDFSFSAQAPEKAGELQWKAYQTYADGTIVHWDQNPSASNESEDSGPYSVTAVTDSTPTMEDHPSSTPEIWGAYALSGLALIIAATALFRSNRSA